jgi:hypothetical protein
MGESNEGKGGDTKRQEKSEGAILEDSRMWVGVGRWRKSGSESVVLMGTVWFGLVLRSRALLARLPEEARLGRDGPIERVPQAARDNN